MHWLLFVGTGMAIGWLIANESHIGFLVLVGVAGLFVACVILRRWQVGLVAIFLSILLEDFVRKSIPSQPFLVLAFKDVLVLFAYAGFLWSQRGRLPMKGLQLILVALSVLFALELIQVFNPVLPSFVLPLVALKIDFLYVPMAFLGYVAIRETRNLSLCVKILFCVALGLILFAAYQVTVAGDETLPAVLRVTGGGHEFHSFGLESVYYTFATFASGAKFAQNLLVMGVVVLAYILWKRPGISLLLRLLAPLPFWLGLILSGSRTPIALFAMISGVYWLLASGTRILRPVPLATLCLLLAGVVAVPSVKDLVQGSARAAYILYTVPEIQARFLLEEEGEYFFLHQLRAALEDRPMVGHGTGSNSSALMLFADDPKYSLSAAEHGPVKILWELGLVGFAVWVVLWLAIGAAGVRTLRRLRGTSLFRPGVLLFVYQISILLWFFKGHQIMGDAQALVYFWFLMGIFHGLPRIADRIPGGNAGRPGIAALAAR